MKFSFFSNSISIILSQIAYIGGLSAKSFTIFGSKTQPKCFGEFDIILLSSTNSDEIKVSDDNSR